MKKSKKITLVASLLYIAIVIILIAICGIPGVLTTTTAGGVPVIVYVMCIVAVLLALIGYPIVNKIEKLEEEGN